MKKVFIILSIICFFLCSCGIESFEHATTDAASVSSGETATLSSNAGEQGYVGAYDFSKQKSAKIGFLEWKDVESYDIYFYDTGFYPFFNGNEYVISTYQQDMGQAELNAITCPADIPGYASMKYMKEENVYCIKTREGKLAKIKVTAMTQNDADYTAAVSFDWEWD